MQLLILRLHMQVNTRCFYKIRILVKNNCPCYYKFVKNKWNLLYYIILFYEIMFY
jgi:hypothetical protein